jgi:hypothetical protein
MNLIKRAVLVFALGLALTVSTGCSDRNIALVGRDTLPARAGQPVQDEFVATVERVNSSSNEIHFRPTSGRPAVVTYSAETRVMFRGREYPVTQLQSGDVVAMQLEKDARGNSHTHLIRVQESMRDWAQGRTY